MSTVKGNSKKRFAECEKGKRVAAPGNLAATAFAVSAATANMYRNDAFVVDRIFEIYKDNPELPEIYDRYCENKAAFMKYWETWQFRWPHYLIPPSFEGEKKEKGIISDLGKKRRSNRIAEKESEKKEKGMISEHRKKRRSNSIAENESKKKKQDDLPKPGQAPRPVGASIPART